MGIDKPKKTQSQIGRMSRNKGASYERRIAAILSLWWTGGVDHRAFRRSVMSGGWDKRFAAGDLVAPITDFPIHIEIRKNESFNLASTIKNGVIMAWWAEAVSKAYAHRKIWFVMSKNGELDYLVMGNLSWLPIQAALERSNKLRTLPYLVFTGYRQRLVICVIQELLALIGPDELMALYKERA